MKPSTVSVQLTETILASGCLVLELMVCREDRERSGQDLKLQIYMARGAPNQKVSTIRLSENILANPTVNVNKTQLDQSQQIQYCDIQEIVENKDLSCYTVIVFHNETTRFSRENDRIIEIALGDVQGGENTTFQTLLSHQQSQLAPFSLIVRIQM